MIIDMILDRKCGSEYDAGEFYRDCMGYSTVFDGIGDNITRAMDFGTETDVRAALCEYVVDNGYDPGICSFIWSVEWLND